FIFLPSDAAPTFNLAPHSVQATITLSATAAGVAAGFGDAAAGASSWATKIWPLEHFTLLPSEASPTFSFFPHSGQLTMAMERYPGPVRANSLMKCFARDVCAK